ncbi:MAG TPA: PepSY-like domain-containing protein [Cyclobacteriaceae bacterium]|nr:PepSY-like domain-containing protein [Cyclobacteriaceae bacterium]
MKNLILIAICLGVTSLGFAQKLKGDELPSAVKTAFKKKYPNVKNVKWEKEGDAFEASFNFQKEEVSALFDAAGNVKEVETEIEKTALPIAVKNLLTKDYAGYKVREAARIVAESVTTYEAEVKKGKESFDLIFSEDGKLLKKEMKKKKD